MKNGGYFLQMSKAGNGSLNNMVYIQADARFNKYLLERIGDKPIIKYVIDKCREINAKNIVFGEFDCVENKALEELMREEDIIIVKNNFDVNKRFIDIVCDFNSLDYVVRVGGDQPLIDTKMINMLLEELEQNQLDYFYDSKISSVVPDIISARIIRQNRNYFEGFNRYFEGLTQLNLKGKDMPYSMLPISVRTNSLLGFRCCKYLIENNLEVKQVVNVFFDRLRNPKNYLGESGIMNSWFLGWEADFFFDAKGKINPWWSDSAIEFIRERLTKNLRVFEYGSGNSTFFFADIVREVISIEHDKEWYNKMKEIVPCNVELLQCELVYGGKYSELIKKYSDVDIVLIDGRDRVNCAKNAIHSLSEEGIIIWDDTERIEYEDGYNYLLNNGFLKIDFSGITHGVAGANKMTSIFYRNGRNIFNI